MKNVSPLFFMGYAALLTVAHAAAGEGLVHFKSDEATKLYAIFTNAQEAYKRQDYALYLKCNQEVLDAKLSDEALAEFTTYRVSAAYNCACGSALLKDKAKALSYLAYAVQLGHDKIESMKRDTDFASIKADKEFVDLIAKFEKEKGAKVTLSGAPVLNAGHPALVVKNDAGVSQRVVLLNFSDADRKKFDAFLQKKQVIQISGTGGGQSRNFGVMAESIEAKR